MQDWGCPLLFGLLVDPPCLAGFVAFYQTRLLWLSLLLLLGLNPTSDVITEFNKKTLFDLIAALALLVL
jgi:hypothetical protein